MKNFSFVSNFWSKIKNQFKSNKRLFLVTVILIVFVVVIFLSTFSFGKNSDSDSSKTKTVSISDYAQNIELKLTKLISQMDSVSNVSVFVMVDALPETKYLTETKKEETTSSSGGTTSTETVTVVFEKNGSISTPVVITTIMPKVSGVMIVTNKISGSTKISIINAVAVVLNIDSSCISFLQES